MKNTTHLTAALLFALFNLSSCEKAQPQPQQLQLATLSGTWQLTQSGGGITGQMQDVPPTRSHQLVFGPDSTYSVYEQGKLVEKSIFHIRPNPSYPAWQKLWLKTTNGPGGIPFYRKHDVVSLTTTDLEFKTQGGCPLISVYKRAEPASSRF